MFDNITKDDLIVAFFPCIYFSCLSQMNISWNCTNYRKLTYKERTDKIIERVKNREKFFVLSIKNQQTIGIVTGMYYATVKTRHLM